MKRIIIFVIGWPFAAFLSALIPLMVIGTGSHELSGLLTRAYIRGLPPAVIIALADMFFASQMKRPFLATGVAGFFVTAAFFVISFDAEAAKLGIVGIIPSIVCSLLSNVDQQGRRPG